MKTQAGQEPSDEGGIKGKVYRLNSLPLGRGISKGAPFAKRISLPRMQTGRRGECYYLSNPRDAALEHHGTNQYK